MFDDQRFSAPLRVEGQSVFLFSLKVPFFGSNKCSYESSENDETPLEKNVHFGIELVSSTK